ncbi:MAG: hypothetical protein V3W34_18000, partial [Phycisphaerae bacterium]
ADRVARARLELLNPGHGELIFIDVIDWQGTSDHWLERVDTTIEGYQRAIKHYDDALWWARFRPEHRRTSLERDTVAAARFALLAASNKSEPRPSGSGPSPRVALRGQLSIAAPITWSVARSWADAGGPQPVAEPTYANATRQDLRCLGLLAFLCGEAELCNRVWSFGRFDLSDASDSLVDASIGQLHLISGRPEFAYPRLERAHRAFPQAGYLCTALADAAVRIGDLDVAHRWLRDAETLDLQDPFENLKRVWADFYAARDAPGDAEQAEKRYREMIRDHTTPTGRIHYARFLERKGNVREALQVLQGAMKLRPEMPAVPRAFIETADRWWEPLPVQERWNVLRRSLDEYPGAPHSLVAILRTYFQSRELPATSKSVADEEKSTGLAENAALPNWDPASFLQRVDLATLANRMEVQEMRMWRRVIRHPRWLKGAQMWAWIAPDPGAMSKHIRAMAELTHAGRRFAMTWRRRMLPATVAAIAVLAPGVHGDWVSVHSGPKNDRRSVGQVLRGNWREVWRSPFAGPHPLVKDGIVVFRTDPGPAGGACSNDGPAQYAGVNLADGVERWVHTLEEGYQTTGCIIAGRVFFPVSNVGSGNPQCTHTQRIESVDLYTGIPAWSTTWDTGNVGGVSALQPLAWDPLVPPGDGVDRVVFTTSDRVALPDAGDTRIVVLDATADAPNPLGQSTIADATWNGTAVAIYSWNAGQPQGKANVLHHEKSRHVIPGGHNWVSTSLRVYDLVSLVEPTEPFLPASSLLSGTTVSDQLWTISPSPTVIGPTGLTGYLYESGGFLRAFDLQNGVEIWSNRISTTNINMMPYVLPGQGAGEHDIVVMIDGDSGMISAYDGVTGDAAPWSPLATPAPPLWTVGCVLDHGIMLIALENGDIYGLDREGALIGRFDESCNLVGFHHEPNLGNVIAVDGKFLVWANGELICYEPAGIGDFDGNELVDLEDYRVLHSCVSGPGVSTPPDCCAPLDFAHADDDDDGDVDLFDFGMFQAAFTAP